jgi:hypothetical protein
MNINIEPFKPEKDTLRILKKLYGISRKQAEIDHYSRMIDRAYRSVPLGEPVNLICHNRRAAMICKTLAKVSSDPIGI